MTYYIYYSVFRTRIWCKISSRKNTSRLFYMTPAKCEIFTVFPLSYLSSTSQVGNSSRHILFSQRPFNVFLFTSPIWEKDTHIRTKYVNSWITADSFLPLALQLLPSYTVHFFSTTYCSQWSWKVNLTVLPYYHCITPSEVSL